MTLPVPFVGIDAAAEQDSAAVAIQGNELLLINQLRKGWPSIALGIILAGGLYPVIVAILAGGIELFFGRPPEASLIEVVILGGFFSLLGAVIGLVWTNVVVVVTLPAIFLVAWSLELRGSIVRLGAVWGGMAGLASLVPFVLIDEFGVSGWEPLLFGPALTTVLGQAGGAWGGRRAARRIGWYKRCLRQASVSEKVDAKHLASGEPGLHELAGTQQRFQFGIRHLMWSDLWLSLLLSLIRLLGVRLELAIPFLIGWLLYQAATLYIGGMLAKWLELRWVGQAAVPRGTTGKADADCAFHVERAIGRLPPDDVTREVVSRETE